MILDPEYTQIIKQCHVTLKPFPFAPRETLLVVITTVMLLIWKKSTKTDKNNTISKKSL